MEVKLVRVGIDEAENLWKMQVRAFLDLYEKLRFIIQCECVVRR